uniref:Uncharacterized protein n=1 Tax=Meloidogyne enterolobii TaxID=390850 RepID=A0A6V7WQZ4_MELEN|nr:unnamed protein product [Meloidogyne enterolobii]
MKAEENSFYILKLSNCLKTIEEMIIARCWLEKLFNCGYERVHFNESVFNPKMIDLLFDGDETIPRRFYNQNLSSVDDINIDMWDFTRK